ncbi:aspartyl-phosphate phosphatase Spo0E family protein [Bacillus sp. FJAT-29814]|nr:aspartyl-phosphate phosphatase Spo0E family protein [Bacillus sp. FJAT-29814]
MCNEELTKRIELLRRKMITVGMKKGLTSPDTISLSKTLDQLINIKMST